MCKTSHQMLPEVDFPILGGFLLGNTPPFHPCAIFWSAFHPHFWSSSQNSIAYYYPFFWLTMLFERTIARRNCWYFTLFSKKGTFCLWNGLFLVQNMIWRDHVSASASPVFFSKFCQPRRRFWAIISPDYVLCHIPWAMAILSWKWKFWNLLVRRRRPLCGFGNFGKKI